MIKNKKILSAVLATQLVLCGNSIFTPKAEAEGIIKKTIDVTFATLKYVVIGGIIVTTTAVSTEVAMAICRKTLCEHTYTPYALRNAGITIDGDIEQFNHKIHTKGYMPFQMWCADKGVTPVCTSGIPVPGLYEYNETYYFLVGNQGINLGTVKEEVLKSVESIYQKAINQAIKTGSNIIGCMTKILPAFKA